MFFISPARSFGLRTMSVCPLLGLPSSPEAATLLTASDRRVPGRAALQSRARAGAVDLCDGRWTSEDALFDSLR